MFVHICKHFFCLFVRTHVRLTEKVNKAYSAYMSLPFEERSAVTLVSAGQKLFAIAHVPLVAGKKVPWVLFCNGFAGFKSARFRLGVRLSEALSRVGIASFRFDYRGTGDSEGSFSDITFQTKLEDTNAAVRFILDHPRCDQDRFALLGRSFGGLVALATAAQNSARAVALWAPVFDTKPWVEYNYTHHAIQREKDGVFFAGQKLSAAFMAEIASLSAAPFLDCLHNVPISIAQPGNDSILGHYHYDHYLAARKKTEAATAARQFLQSNHDFDVPSEQQELIDFTTEWLAKQLL